MQIRRLIALKCPWNNVVSRKYKPSLCFFPVRYRCDFLGSVSYQQLFAYEIRLAQTSHFTSDLFEASILVVKERGTHDFIAGRLDTRQINAEHRCTNQSTKYVRKGSRQMGEMRLLHSFALAALVVFVLYAVVGSRWKGYVDVCNCTVRETTELCSHGTILTVTEGGRTGNAVWEYLSVLAVAKLHPRMHFAPYVPDGIKEAMEKVFEPGTIPGMSELPESCRDLRPKVEVAMEDTPDFVRKLPKDVRHVNLALYSARFEEVFEYGFHQVRKELRFKKDEVNAVEDKLREIRRKYKVPDGVEPVFVGVYYRGTDYHNSIDLFYKDQYKIPDHEFYARAMAHFERLYRFVIFVLVTIDEDWLATNLPHFKGNVVVKPFVDDMPKDLIVLSLCNHTIVNYGTFAMTAAMLNNGTKIVYDLGVPVNFDGVTIAMKAAMHLPNWILMK